MSLRRRINGCSVDKRHSLSGCGIFKGIHRLLFGGTAKPDGGSHSEPIQHLHRRSEKVRTLEQLCRSRSGEEADSKIPRGLTLTAISGRA